IPSVNATVKGPKCVRKSLANFGQFSCVAPSAEAGLTITSGNVITCVCSEGLTAEDTEVFAEERKGFPLRASARSFAPSAVRLLLHLNRVRDRLRQGPQSCASQIRQSLYKCAHDPSWR